MFWNYDSYCVIMFVILMTTLYYKALILQGEIWCWSLLGLKGLIEVSNSPYKGIQDSLGVWIPRGGFQIPGTRFQSLSVELGFRIPKPRISD